MILRRAKDCLLESFPVYVLRQAAVWQIVRRCTEVTAPLALRAGGWGLTQPEPPRAAPAVAGDLVH